MEKVKKEKIKQALKEFFSKADDAEFYFFKTLKEFSNSVLIKSKKVNSEKLPEANLLLKKELADPAIELLNWIETCRMLFREWKIVRKNSKYTCLLGEPASYENKEKGWIWGKTKTKNRCMSYFVGECDSEKRLKEH